MPGSRAGEIRKLLPLLRNAVAILTSRRSDLDIILVKADSVPESLLREIAGEVGAHRVVDMAHIAGLVAGGAHPSHELALGLQ